MEGSRRQKRVASLVQEELSRLLIADFRDVVSGLITVTGVQMSPDLQSARVSVSVFGQSDKKAVLDLLNEHKGYIRKCVASRVKLKYNPQLFFSLDERADSESKIEKILEKIKQNER